MQKDDNLISNSELLEGVVQIPINLLLNSDEPEMALGDLVYMKNAIALLPKSKIAESRFFSRLLEISIGDINRVHDSGGSPALARLNFLLMTSDDLEFNHLFQYIVHDLNFRSAYTSNTVALNPDNERLTAHPDIDNFAHNVINPSLSRKLFNPRASEGFIVYGLVRPRILISMPFKGWTRYGYDVYRNSLDIVASLNIRGYFGTFLIFDYIDGLNQNIAGLPAWVAFFSLIASQADAVIFVTEMGEDLTPSQRYEAAFTPNRVPKKIVTLQTREMLWKKHDDLPDNLPIFNLSPEGRFLSEAETSDYDAAFALTLIEKYRRDSLPNDRTIVVQSGYLVEIYPDGRQVKKPLVNNVLTGDFDAD